MMLTRVSLALLCWLVATAPAHGQFDNADALRALEASCVAGEFTASESQIERLRNGAQATMLEYFRRASASEVADVSNLFSRRQRVWRRLADVASKELDLRAIADPLARAGAAPLQEPEVFFRAGDRETSAGLWIVRAADDSARVIGYYRAAFRWEFGRWKLESLELGEADSGLTLTPYCHGIGDIDAHNEEAAQDERSDD